MCPPAWKIKIYIKCTIYLGHKSNQLSNRELKQALNRGNVKYSGPLFIVRLLSYNMHIFTPFHFGSARKTFSNSISLSLPAGGLSDTWCGFLRVLSCKENTINGSNAGELFSVIREVYMVSLNLTWRHCGGSMVSRWSPR